MAIPGTEIEIIVMIVRKDISFNKPHKYWMNIESPKFKINPPGTAAVDMKLVPSLNLDANSAAPDDT